MRPGCKIAPLIVGFYFFTTFFSPASAKTAGYCLECHSHPFVRTLPQAIGRYASEDRSVYSAKLGSCPGLRSLSEEIFFTENRVIRLNRILRTLEAQGWVTDRLKKAAADSAASLSDLKGHEMVSVQQISKEASAIRAALQKVYDPALKARGESIRRWFIGLGSLFLLGLLILIGLGYRKLGRMGKPLLVFLLLGEMFSSNACTSSPPDLQKKSLGQERLEQSLSLANHITRQMEETFYQSCLLAEMSREWAKIEPSEAEKGFRLAWQMSLTAREKAGQTQTLQEIASRRPDQEKATQEKIKEDTLLDLRDELRNADRRTWALRAIAEEWMQVNPKGGRLALEYATKEALARRDPELRSRELKAIAEAWAGRDEARSLEIARSMTEPFLKALALNQVALSASDKGKAEMLLQEAWKVAEAVPTAYSQLRAMIQISAAAATLFPQKRNAWLDRTLLQIQHVKEDQLKAFALQELVFHWSPLDVEQAKRLAMEIPRAFPEERAYALIFLAKSRKVQKAKALTLLKEAYADTLRISDPFETQKVTGLIGKELAQREPREALRFLPGIEDAFYRSEVLGALALELSKKDRKEALDLAVRIPIEPIRIKISVDLIRQSMDRNREGVNALYREALRAAMTLADPYTRASILIEVGKSWNRIERGMESKLFEMALTSAEKISSPWMKAEIIEDVAEGWKHSDKVRPQALLDGVDPSVLRVRKSLDEVRQRTAADPEKARQLAEAIPSQFPFEKATAFKEVAGNLKKAEPRTASDLFERAIELTLTLPEGHRGRRLLSPLVMEAARLDKERTLRKIRQVSEPETRDLLFSVGSGVWIQEDLPFALKAALEISDGSLRLALYQKMADDEAKRHARSMTSGPDQTGLLALSYWGLGRERAKKDESQAPPYYEKALGEIRKIKDPKERSYLLSGLAAEWAPLDEEKALQISEEVSPEFAESLSCGLLHVGTQLKKWNRKEAERVFPKAVSAAARVEDPRLRARRLLQIGQQWQVINREKGKEVLSLAEGEVRRSGFLPGKEDPLLAEILIVQSALDPHEPLTAFQKTDPPFVRAKVLLERGRIESKGVEEQFKVLEKALQYAQKTKQYRLMSEISLAWFRLDPEKGLEVCNQIEPKEVRVKTLCQMVQKNTHFNKEELRRLLEKAVQEALLIQGLTEKIESLKEIAQVCVAVDQAQAKAVYRKAYRIIEKAAS